MCTLVVAHRAFDPASVVVVANRDEFLARPSLPPAVRTREPPVFCGLDDKEGGTWFGINAHGLVVGLTNLTLRPPDPKRRSRGLVCLKMLALKTAAQVREALERLPHHAFNPFHLVALDGTTAVRVRYADAPEVEVLPPGVHATTNWPVGSGPDAKRIAIESRVATRVGHSRQVEALDAGLQQEARRHDGGGDPRQSVCCHAPGYGTRASTVVLLDPDGRRVRVGHADGPPCSTDFADRTAEVSGMLAFKPF